MLLGKTHFVNFGCLKDFQYTFKRGITVFSGENGQGKSTIFHALLLAIFDTYDGTLKDFVNWDATGFLVEVSFTHCGHAYFISVKYDLLSETTTRVLVIDNDPLKTFTGQGATDHLKNVLDPDLTKAAMISNENQLDIIVVKPADRRDYLKKIYELEFARQQEDLSEMLSSATERQLITNTKLSELYGKKYDKPALPELPFSEESFNDRKNELLLVEDKIRTLGLKVNAYENAVLSVAKASERKTSLEKSLVLAKQEHVRLVEVQRQLPTSFEVIKKLQEEKVAEAQKSVDNLPPIEHDLARFDQELSEIILVRESLFDDSILLDTVSKIATCEAEIVARSSSSTVCSRCGQPLPEKEITDNLTRINELQKMVEQYKQTDQEQRTLQAECKRVSLQNSLRRELKSNLQQKRSLLETEYLRRKSLVDSNLALETTKLVQLDSEQQNKKAMLEKDIELCEEKCATLERDYAEATRVLAGLSDIVLDNPSEELKKITETWNTLSSEVELFREVKIRQREIQNRWKEIDAEEERDNQEKKRLNSNLQELATTIADIESAKKIFKTEFPVWMISRLVKGLEYDMNDFLRQTYGGRYQVTIEDKRNALQILYGPKKKDVKIAASGYEKQVFSLAWKVALGKAAHVNSMWLDEVDSAASVKNSESLYRVIGDSAKLLDQIFLVSHKGSTKDLLELEYNATVLTFENGVLIKE